MEERAKVRFEEEMTEHQQKLQQRKDKEEATGKKPRGRKPKPPEEGPQPKDQYIFTGPESAPEIYAAMQRHHHGRTVEQLEKRVDPPAPPADATVAEIMKHRLETKAGKALYGLRKQTVEPVFGIIKEVLGFRRFSMRGLAKCNSEWDLVSTSYNLKRLFALKMSFKSC